ncbi:alkaline phosphatase family protein [Methyloversatilis thermotolerans]|uniref:hypothetical protein n=1 Tax=Methyloversatilis thermotolerans TaxID=1346290 RepID=UPI000370BF53|nr:hypothetical protein [Methyloversatilis thermotolerans]
MKALPQWGLALLSLCVLNALCAFGNDWPGALPRFEWTLSVEFALLVGVLALCAMRGRAPSGLALNALALLALIWVGLHYIDVTVPALLGRPFNVWWDGRHAWAVAAMAMASWTPLIAATVLAVALLSAGLLFFVLREALRVLGRGLLRLPALRIICLTLSLALLSVWMSGAGAGHRDEMFARPVASMLADQAGLLARALSPRGEQALGPGPDFSADLDALAGADVVIVFAEAYGAVTVDNAELSARLAPGRERLLSALRESGRQVFSARVTSPTFGGASWLAHAALLSGIDTRDPDDYRLLLTTHRPTLVSHFAHHGYRTVGWMPGLQSAWPEGAFFGFDRLAGLHDLGYSGPAFGFWQVPDQAAMAALMLQELSPVAMPQAGLRRAATGAGARAPRFVVFPTVTTHAPFHPVAPYLDNWHDVLDGRGFDPDRVAALRAVPASWSDAVPAYVQAMRYQFDWLSGWLARQAPHDAVIIVIGDHQPVSAVSGKGADWDVPVHLITSSTLLSARLQAEGWAPGLDPAGVHLGAMQALTARLVELFSACHCRREGPPPDGAVSSRH